VVGGAAPGVVVDDGSVFVPGVPVDVVGVSVGVVVGVPAGAVEAGSVGDVGSVVVGLVVVPGAVGVVVAGSVDGAGALEVSLDGAVGPVHAVLEPDVELEPGMTGPVTGVEVVV